MKKIMFALMILCGPFVLEGATLRAIIMGDTNDYNVGHFINTGTQEMEKEMRSIALYTGMDLEITTLKGNDFNGDKILETLDNLGSDEQDVVFLFSFSHGYREGSTTTPWPSINLPENKGVDQLVLTEILQEKHPRLLISMFICCNNYVSEWYKPTRIRFFDGLKAADSIDLVRENYQRLYLDTTGTILISSSVPGKYSYADNHYGEIFLSSFLDIFREYSQKAPLEWPVLFQMAHDRTGQISGRGIQEYYPQIDYVNYKGP